jgi:hypothetical protein
VIIYKLQYENNVYIGRTSDFKKRIREHRCAFKRADSPFSGVCQKFDDISREILDEVKDKNFGSFEMSEIMFHRAMGYNVLNVKHGDFSAKKINSNHGLKSVKLSELMREKGSDLQKLSTISKLMKKPLIKVYDKQANLIIESRCCVEISKKIKVNSGSVNRYLRKERKSKNYSFFTGDAPCQ